MAQATARMNERTTPRATFRRGQLRLQSNEIFGRTNPIPERSRRRANCAQAFVAGPAVFPLYFQRASRRSERHVATRGPGTSGCCWSRSQLPKLDVIWSLHLAHQNNLDGPCNYKRFEV